MKKYLPVLTALTLATTTLFTPGASIIAKEKEKVEKLKIESKGHANAILYETVDYDASTQEETIQETIGENLDGKFKVDTQTFEASIKNEETKESYELEGKIEQVLEEGKAYYYKGEAAKNDRVKFEAIVEKGTGKDYEAKINIFEYDKKNDEEPIESKTFVFDGEGKKTKKYKEKSDRKPIKMKKVKGKDGGTKLQALSEDEDDYYKRIQAASGRGFKYRIQGPLETRVDAGNNHSFRWGTDIEDIEEILEDRDTNYKYTGQHDVVNFRLRIESDDPMVFNTVEPISESKKSFGVPMYFGSQIGVVMIPVTASTIKISGSGTDNLLYDFKWNQNYFPTGYLDERDFDKDPGRQPGFAVRYFVDTASSIDEGTTKIKFSGYFKYRSIYNYYTLLLHDYTEITKKDYYTIDIVE